MQKPRIDESGNKFWYNQSGLGKILHRTNGPAVIKSDGTKFWFINGKQHRTNGPAAEYPNGTKFWFINGKQHRTNGPAKEYPYGKKYYYLNDERVTIHQYYLLNYLCKNQK